MVLFESGGHFLSIVLFAGSSQVGISCLLSCFLKVDDILMSSRGDSEWEFVLNEVFIF